MIIMSSDQSPEQYMMFVGSVILFAIIFLGAIWLFQIIYTPTAITGSSGTSGTLDLDTAALSEITDNTSETITVAFAGFNLEPLFWIIVVSIIVLAIYFIAKGFVSK